MPTSTSEGSAEDSSDPRFLGHEPVRLAAIRADRTIRAPDTIQLACAAAAGVDLFITNDDRLSRKVMPGVKFITSLAGAYL